MGRSDLWETPYDVFFYIEDKFLKDRLFDVDLCGDMHNSKVNDFVSEETNLFSLAPSNFKENSAAWMNPPYRKKSSTNTYDFSQFFKYASDVRLHSKIPVAVLVSTTISSSKIFQDLVGSTPAERKNNNAEIYFYPKRIKFLDMNKKIQSTPSFSSMVIIFRPFEETK